VSAGSLSTIVKDIDKYYGKRREWRKWKDKEYTVLRGVSTNPSKVVVELEDATNQQEFNLALDTLSSFTRMLTTRGAAWWIMILMYGIALMCVQREMARYIYLTTFLVIGTYQMWCLNDASLAVSTFTFEGKPCVRIMSVMSGMGDCRVLTAFALLNLNGILSRVLFASMMFHASSVTKELFKEEYPMLAFTDMWVLALSVIAVGVLFKVGLAIMNYKTICTRINECKSRDEGEDDWAVGINLVIDDLGSFSALAANLDAICQTFYYAALPCSLEDQNDAYRVWDTVRSKTLKVAAYIFPDSILSLYLQLVYQSLLVRNEELYSKAFHIGLLLSTWLPTLKVGIDMLVSGHVLVVSCGLMILACCLHLLFMCVHVFVYELPAF